MLYAGVNDNDKAFESLGQAFAARDNGLTYLLVRPCVDALRTDQRFASLLRRVGFPAS